MKIKIYEKPVITKFISVNGVEFEYCAPHSRDFGHVSRIKLRK